MGVKVAAETLKRDTAKEGSPLLLLVLLTATANTGGGGVRDGGQLGTVPPVKHPEDKADAAGDESEHARVQVAAEQGAQWKWVIGLEGLSQGKRGEAGARGSVTLWSRAAELA
jgi:hypothetical protein